MMRSLLLTAAVGLLLAAPATAIATCSPPTDVAQALGEASTVFVGEVAATTEDGHTATMRVVSIWKGRDLPGRVEVHGTDSTGENAAKFVAGATYLVVPENSRTPFLASICSATRPYEPTGSAIPAAYQEAVGAAEGRTPEGSSVAADAADAKVLRTAALGIVSAGVIATGLLVIRIWRPTTRTPMSDAPPQSTPQPPPRTQGSSRSARRRMRHIQRMNRKL
jgi:hypothetical protein